MTLDMRYRSRATSKSSFGDAVSLKVLGVLFEPFAHFAISFQCIVTFPNILRDSSKKLPPAKIYQGIPVFGRIPACENGAMRCVARCLPAGEANSKLRLLFADGFSAERLARLQVTAFLP